MKVLQKLESPEAGRNDVTERQLTGSARTPQLRGDANEKRDQHAGGDDMHRGLRSSAPHELDESSGRMLWMVRTASFPPRPTSPSLTESQNLR